VWCPLARLVSLAALALAVGVAPRPARAGDLNQVESAHKDKPKDKSADPDGSSSTSSSKRSSGGGGSNVAGSILGGLVSGLFSSSGSTSSEEDALAAPRSLAMLSYAEDDRSSAYTELAGPQARMRRYGELSLSGFSAVTSTVRALDAQLNLFLRAWTVHAAVGRFYEPDATNLQTLDVLRLQIGWNLFHGWVEAAELHVTGGVLGLHGNDWTPGGQLPRPPARVPLPSLLARRSRPRPSAATIFACDMDAPTADLARSRVNHERAPLAISPIAVTRPAPRFTTLRSPRSPARSACRAAGAQGSSVTETSSYQTSRAGPLGA
jgi:hypothetical protein